MVPIKLRSAFARLDVLMIMLAVATSAYVGLQLWRHFHPDPPNYSRIEEGLFMGGWLDEPPPGVTAVLNLCEREDAQQSPAHSWTPIEDAAPAPTLAWLGERVAFVESHRHAGRSVYVHCLAGISRSGLVTVAYLMKKCGWTRDAALAYVRENRPVASPNPAFMELLLEWEKSLMLPAGASGTRELS